MVASQHTLTALARYPDLRLCFYLQPYPLTASRHLHGSLVWSPRFRPLTPTSTHTPLLPFDFPRMVGLNSSANSRRTAQLVSRQTKIVPSRWIDLGLPNPPRYQQYNLEFINVENGQHPFLLSGDLYVLCACTHLG